ncbi:MAG: outer membrane protein assembly factor BamE [Fibrobacteria bacterium]|nr:outer membrane protein assembly factor BamE [Fibrobacteria bacterium]
MKNIFLLTILFLNVSFVYSKDKPIDKLEERIENLELRVVELEKIVAEKNEPKGATSNTTVPKLKQWRKLQKGMSQEDVRNLLGEPLRIEAGPFIHWYY